MLHDLLARWLSNARKTFPKILLLLLMLWILLPVKIGWGGYRVEWHIDGTVQEQYNDNLHLSEHDPVDDFITTLSPGGELLVSSQTGRLSLVYHLNANIYTLNPEFNYVGHSAVIEIEQTLQRHLLFGLRDTFLLTDEPREVRITEPLRAEAEPRPTEFEVGTRFQRNRYYRNNLSPFLEWQYGMDDRIRGTYRNEIYRNEEFSTSDSTRDTFGVEGEHWFGAWYGLLYEFEYSRAHFVTSSDFNGQDALLTFKRRLTPHTAIFIQGGLSNRMFENEALDYITYRGSMGVEHAFSPLVSGSLRAGYFYRVPEEGPSGGNPEGEAAIRVLWKRFRGSAFIRGGFVESYIDAENLGFAEFASLGTAFEYGATRRITLSLDGSLSWYDFPSGEQRTNWNIRGGASVILLKWLTGSLELQRLQQTGKNTTEYTNHRITFRITARY